MYQASDLRNMNKKKNFIAAVLNQIVVLLCGVIVPQIIIRTFGSSINGLLSSITQFLSFISLLEGGLGAVVLSELYKPIEEDDKEKIQSVLNASQRLFGIIGLIYIAYALLLSLVYPLFVDEFDYGFVSSLVLILSLSSLAQYMFSITKRLLIQAEQSVYVVYFVSSITNIANLLITLLLVSFFPSIHFLKLFSSIAFFIQPFVYSAFINKKMHVHLLAKKSQKKHMVLKNRWSGFGQNFAHFININTDIVLVTLFMGLSSVSVYVVYMLAINALKGIVSMINDSYQSALGKYYAQKSSELKNRFCSFHSLNSFISASLFMSCLVLIVPFVRIYVNGVVDANYHQPLFALVMVLANLIYCLREPERMMVLAAGKFKETNFGSFCEAFINLSVSLVLVNFLGLAGIAIGTLVAVLYRYIYLVSFLEKKLIRMELRYYFEHFLRVGILITINVFLFFLLDLHITSFATFFVYGIIVFMLEIILACLLYLGPRKSALMLISLLKTKR